MGKNLSFQERATQVIRQENIVGHIKKSYGESGELVVNIYDTFPESAIPDDAKQHTAEPLWVEIDSLAVPLFVGSYHSRGLSKAVITFDDFDSESRASELQGLRLYAESPEAPDAQDESPYSLLVGYELTDAISGRKGRVAAFYDYPNNPLLEVEFEGKSAILVPVADELVDKIDHRRGRMTVRVAAGLFDLDSLPVAEQD